MPNDPVIDRSFEQKKLQLEKLKAELFELGYIAVSAEWIRRHPALERAIAS